MKKILISLGVLLLLYINISFIKALIVHYRSAHDILISLACIATCSWAIWKLVGQLRKESPSTRVTRQSDKSISPHSTLLKSRNECSESPITETQPTESTISYVHAGRVVHRADGQNLTDEDIEHLQATSLAEIASVIRFDADDDFAIDSFENANPDPRGSSLIDGKLICVAQQPAMLLNGQAVNPKTREPLSSEQLLFYRQCAELNKNRDRQVLEDCIDIVYSTKTTDVFFSRYELLIETLEALLFYHALFGAPYKDTSVILSKALESRDALTCDFIKRSHTDMIQKASTLKTEKGRHGRYIRYYDSFSNYEDQLEPESKALLKRCYTEDLPTV